ncbi:fungal-specific transcription factor domain-containing protein [Lasiosphaeria miniovina]|uniref:Fungal-specific transcription factor domain-containing protein n=1 Tax=Lasiosphaeria miniovina TaxID=1954250 RepID=A0AA40DU78_9PEZI|nr:fungal-specific transcription factor domain-containing protein [Lasiosphaeria miniovina]KAK0713572.1 fungal-specific transcription factor domain-containing protein [Lasiosphaeria miniovina]
MPSTTAAPPADGINAGSTREGNKSAKSGRQNPGPACQHCRMRKFRCDRQRPCGGCVDAGLRCRFDPTPPQKGPKKGHLKLLRSRIAALERKMGETPEEDQDDHLDPRKSPGPIEVRLDLDDESDYGDGDGDWDSGPAPSQTQIPTPVRAAVAAVSSTAVAVTTSAAATALAAAMSDIDTMLSLHIDIPPFQTSMPMSSPTSISSITPSTKNFPGHHPVFLGPTPPAAAPSMAIPPLIRTDLDQLYFDRVHVFIPILHRRRYFARGRPGAGASASYACLQAAIRTLAAALSSQFNHLRHDLYHDALRRLNHPASCAPGGGSAEDDETRRLELAQAWILVAIYEFMQGTVQRAWTSAGLAIRIVQLMRLHDVDGGAAPAHLDMGVDDPNAFVDREVKRRVFWVAFCLDRFSCVLEKLPLTLDEKTILTRLPCPEQAFQSQTPVTMPFLSDLDAAPDSISLQSPFVDSIVFTAIWGRALCHQQQCAAESARGGPAAEVCRRHVQLHDLLSCRMLHFERSYTAASVEADSLLLFTSMVAQVSVLALADAADLIPAVAAGYADVLALGYAWRGPAAAREIARLAEYLPQFSLFKVHPFTPIPLFLCRQLLLKLGPRDGALDGDLGVITRTLEELREVNQLCQEKMDVGMALETMCYHPGFLDGADGMLSPFDKDMMML